MENNFGLQHDFSVKLKKIETIGKLWFFKISSPFIYLKKMSEGDGGVIF